MKMRKRRARAYLSFISPPRGILPNSIVGKTMARAIRANFFNLISGFFIPDEKSPKIDFINTSFPRLKYSGCERPAVELAALMYMRRCLGRYLYRYTSAPSQKNFNALYPCRFVVKRSYMEYTTFQTLFTSPKRTLFYMRQGAYSYMLRYGYHNEVYLQEASDEAARRYRTMEIGSLFKSSKIKRVARF